MTSTPSPGLRIAAAATLAAAIGVTAALVVARRGAPPAPAARTAAEPDAGAAAGHPAAASLAAAPAADPAALAVAPERDDPASTVPKRDRAERPRRDGPKASDEPPQMYVPPPQDPEKAEAAARERAVAVGFAAADRTARELSLSFDEAARLRDVLARIETRRVSIASKLAAPDADKATIQAETKEFGDWAKQELSNEFGAELGKRIANHARLAHVGYEQGGAPRDSSGGKGKKGQGGNKAQAPSGKKKKKDG